MSGVFRRTAGEPVVAVRGEGAWVVDEAGKRYLDAAGGAVAVSIGHGDHGVAAAMQRQAAQLAYVHAAAFTTEVVEAYAAELSTVLPVDDPYVFPVSGGAEAVETAFKLARAYHLARGEPDRHVVVARRGSYHGNTRGALDASGRAALRMPYEPWLGQTVHVPPVYEYRCPSPAHPTGCGEWHADRLAETFERVGAERVAAFIAEPVAGAALGAAVPPDDYWHAVARVCREHGVLLIADEVMTGFGRTGTWFAVDHWGVRPDILVAAKGASSGYWPLGICAASGVVHDAVAARSFVHGYTWSHHPVGAAVGSEVLRRLKAGGLVERAGVVGERLRHRLGAALAESPAVGDVRGRGMLLGVELVADRASKTPFPRSARITEQAVAAARRRGMLVYSATGHVAGDGDLLLLGPPFTIDDNEEAMIIERLAAAIDSVSGTVS
jgi:adenosylmethionine-8-amino-7-oxononanoate aminotransferase